MTSTASSRSTGLIARLRALGPGVLLGTARLYVRCRLAGVSTDGLSSSSWRTPQLITGGTIRIGGGCFFVCRRLRAQIGAERGGVLVMGGNNGLNDGVTLVATRAITIGRNTRFGEFAAVFDTDYHQIEKDGEVRSAPVVIGDNVWVARGALVLPGVTVGDNTVIAAQSVVTQDLPANCIAAGNPARVIRTIADGGKWSRG